MPARRAAQAGREPDREPRTQFAALPWRRTEAGAVEVLLITSRETRRWVIPKGWPIKGMTSPKSAAREAFEEAGVMGAVEQAPRGAYHYDKRLKSGRVQRVRVSVFALQVAEERDSFPEQHQREKLWLAGAEAAGCVDEPELRDLLAAFEP